LCVIADKAPELNLELIRFVLYKQKDLKEYQRQLSQLL